MTEDSEIFDQAASAPADERIARALRDRILEGHLPPGTQLRDSRLSAEFAVARHTLRGALRRLEHEGLIVYPMHKSAAVKTLTADDVHEIYRVRRALELGAIENSSAAPAEAFEALEATVYAAESAVSQEAWNHVGTASLRFHQAIVGMFGSVSIDQFFSGVLAQLRLAFAVMKDEAQWQTPWVPRDREICGLIRSGNRAGAAALTRQYLDDSERGVVDVVRANEMNQRRPVRRRRANAPEGGQ
ncbi:MULTISPECIES: GntR family transcriptional regulator [Amycolatopsis]|uniref:GntR family transcriptional regulator n=1 Tax=Amycolatopsis albidoflavus TaxID=102226 RepID=A0ABW5I6L6_9PSEU